MEVQPNEQAPRPEDQLEAIRSMLSAGHHSITLELHSFFVWGLATAAALEVFPRIFISRVLPSPVVRALAEILSAAVLLALTAAVDYRISVRAKRSRDETFSWVQRQMGKLSLLFALLGLMLAFGSHFYPWQSVIYVFFLGLMGVALAAHGFFSEPFLVWAGLASIGLAAAEVALQFPFEATHWMTTSAFGLGLTTLGPLQRWVRERGVMVRAACLLAWLGVVAAAGIGTYELTRQAGEPPLFSLAVLGLGAC